MLKENKVNVVLNFAIISLVVISVIVIFQYLLIWLLPFVIGSVVAIVLQYPLNIICKHTKIPRAISTLVLVILVLALLVSVVWLIGYALYAKLYSLSDTLTSTYTYSFSELSNNLSAKLEAWESGSGLSSNIFSIIETVSATLITELITSLTLALKNVGTKIITFLPGFIFNFVISIIATYFMTKDYYKITGFLSKQTSTEKWSVAMAAKNHLVVNTFKFIKGYFILGLITMAQLSIGLAILGMENPVTSAFFISLLDALPIFGTGVAMVPWAIMLLVTGNVWQGVGLLIVYGAVLLVRQILEPKVIGDQVGLPPILTLLAMIFGLKVFGFFGLIGFPVLLIMLKNLNDSGKIKLWK